MSKNRTGLYLGLAAAGAGGYYLYRAGGDVKGAKHEMKGMFLLPSQRHCDFLIVFSNSANLLSRFQLMPTRRARSFPAVAARRNSARALARRLVLILMKLYSSRLFSLSMVTFSSSQCFLCVALAWPLGDTASHSGHRLPLPHLVLHLMPERSGNYLSNT